MVTASFLRAHTHFAPSKKETTRIFEGALPDEDGVVGKGERGERQIFLVKRE